MKDFPVFVTEHGAASLTLSQIPYTGNGFVRIKDSKEPGALLKDCVEFCNAAGAERIYATGHPVCAEYPVYTEIVQMQICRETLQPASASLFPVTEKTLSAWLDMYNRKIKNVPTAVWMTHADGQQMLQQGSGYFVHKNGELLGIGKVYDDELQWVAAVRPGAGREVVCTLLQTVTADTVKVTVATGNTKAIRLYRKMGFVPVHQYDVWYKIR